MNYCGYLDLCMKYLAIGSAYLQQLGMSEMVLPLHMYLHTVMDN